MRTRRKTYAGLLKVGLFDVTLNSSFYTEVKQKNPPKKLRPSSPPPRGISETRGGGEEENGKKVSNLQPVLLMTGRKLEARHSRRKEEQGEEKKIGRPSSSRLPKIRRPTRSPSPRRSEAQVSGKKGDEDKIHRPTRSPSPRRSEARESEKKEAEDKIWINRAPVLTMWVAVVAKREGFKFEEGLSFGKAIAGLMAQSKGRRLGIYEEPTEEKKAERKRKRKDLDRFRVFGMNVPGKKTPDGLHLALQSGNPISPSSVETYLHRGFGPNYERAKVAMEHLANSYPPQEVGKAAYGLYEKFRPSVRYGVKGWGAKGVLDVESMQALSKQ